jgi:hypothetical protein
MANSVMLPSLVPAPVDPVKKRRHLSQMPMNFAGITGVVSDRNAALDFLSAGIEDDEGKDDDKAERRYSPRGDTGDVELRFDDAPPTTPPAPSDSSSIGGSVDDDDVDSKFAKAAVGHRGAADDLAVNEALDVDGALEEAAAAAAEEEAAGQSNGVRNDVGKGRDAADDNDNDNDNNDNDNDNNDDKDNDKDNDNNDKDKDKDNDNNDNGNDEKDHTISTKSDDSNKSSNKSSNNGSDSPSKPVVPASATPNTSRDSDAAVPVSSMSSDSDGLKASSDGYKRSKHKGSKSSKTKSRARVKRRGADDTASMSSSTDSASCTSNASAAAATAAAMDDAPPPESLMNPALLASIARSSRSMSSRRNSNAGFDETTLFIAKLKDPLIIRALVNKALRVKEPQASAKTIELICLMLRIQPNITKATEMATPNNPPPLLSLLIAPETTTALYSMLRVRGEKKKPGAAGVSLASLSSSHGSVMLSNIPTNAPPLGFLRLAVVKLIKFIHGTGFASADTAMIESKLLSRCLDLGFIYQRHSVLHSILADLLEMLLHDPKHDAVASYLIRKYHLTKKIVQFLGGTIALSTDGGDGGDGGEAASDFTLDPSFRAYLILLANLVLGSRKAKKVLRKTASFNDPWQQFVNDILTPINEEQYVDPAKKPPRDLEKSNEDAQKWARRWDDFGFMLSYQ